MDRNSKWCNMLPVERRQPQPPSCPLAPQPEPGMEQGWDEVIEYQSASKPWLKLTWYLAGGHGSHASY